jgi:tetratricopeptide (TPR) repeat protein
MRPFVVAVVGVALGHSPTAADNIPISHRLAEQFQRAALAMIEIEPFTVAAAHGSLVLFRIASELKPDDPELWRTYLEAAQLIESELHLERASEAVRRLDPRDDVVSLLRIQRALDRHQTVEERKEAAARLLEPTAVSQLGPVIASRIAFDLALLEQRCGDTSAYSHRLAQAASFDPANRQAVAAAAGFFRSARLDDPVGEAELLLGVVIADPTDIETTFTLGEILLEHGAYEGARRIYLQGVAGSKAAGRTPADNLLADLAITLWGSGDADGALEIIHDRQRNVNGPYRRDLLKAQPTMTLVQVADHHAPLAPTLETVRAAIHHRQRSAEAPALLERALRAYAEAIRAAEDGSKGKTADPGEAARLRLEAAWVALWLSAPTERVETLLREAESIEPLSAEARARFDGCIALRRGEIDAALAALRPLADEHPAAALGMAMAHLARGERREAAQRFLAVARGQPGTLMGVFCADYLAELLGQRAPLSETSQRLNALIATLPQVVDRFADNPSLAVALRVVPAKERFQPFEPIIINIHIVNNAPFPMAIDEIGPIRLQAALLPFAQIPNAPNLDLPQAVIVNLGRRLRLEPREQMIVPFDLRRTRLNQVLNAYPQVGATLRLTGISNYVVSTQGAVLPGLLGTRVETPPFRVDGVRVTEEWVRQNIRSIREGDPGEQIVTVVLLAYVVAMKGVERIKPEVENPAALSEEAASAVVEAYTRLDPESQAWLVDRLPGSFIVDPIAAMARKSEHKVVQISYLLTRLTGRNDPMLGAGLRSEDEDVRAIAQMMDAVVERLLKDEE